VHLWDQHRERGRAGVDRAANGDAHEPPDVRFDGADLVAREVQRLVRVLVAEVRLSIDAAGGVADVDLVALELIEVGRHGRGLWHGFPSFWPFLAFSCLSMVAFWIWIARITRCTPVQWLTRSRRIPRSESTRWAALWPAAPMTEPAGW